MKKTLTIIFTATFYLFVQVLQGKQQPPDGWEFYYGAGILVKPEYSGSDNYEALPLPSLRLRYKDQLDINARHVNYTFLRNDGFSTGPALSWEFGRDENDDRKLRGLGNISPTLSGGFFFKYHPQDSYTHYELHFQHDLLNEHNGFKAIANVTQEFYIPYIVMFGSANLQVIFASNEYMNTYYGISQEQSAYSIHSPFNADPGIKSGRVNLRLIKELQNDWAMLNLFSYERLMNDARDTPLNDTMHQYWTGIFFRTTF